MKTPNGPENCSGELLKTAVDGVMQEWRLFDDERRLAAEAGHLVLSGL